MNKDILPTNKEGFHGYCEWYWSNGQLGWKGTCSNGFKYGYQEQYRRDGSVNKDWVGYFLDDNRISKDNKEGYCYIWNRQIKKNGLLKLRIIKVLRQRLSQSK